jgi:hypothetical protein
MAQSTEVGTANNKSNRNCETRVRVWRWEQELERWVRRRHVARSHLPNLCCHGPGIDRNGACERLCGEKEACPR